MSSSAHDSKWDEEWVNGWGEKRIYKCIPPADHRWKAPSEPLRGDEPRKEKPHQTQPQIVEQAPWWPAAQGDQGNATWLPRGEGLSPIHI